VIFLHIDANKKSTLLGALQALDHDPDSAAFT
jgi:hypothetical protein